MQTLNSISLLELYTTAIYLKPKGSHSVQIENGSNVTEFSRQDNCSSSPSSSSSFGNDSKLVETITS